MDASGNKVSNFNDTTDDKANSFNKDNVFVAMALWKFGRPICIIFGRCVDGLSKYFIETTNENKNKDTNKRNVINVRAFDFIDKYGFKIITEYEPVEILRELGSFDKRFYGLECDNVIPLSNFDIRKFISKENLETHTSKKYLGLDEPLF